MTHPLRMHGRLRIAAAIAAALLLLLPAAAAAENVVPGQVIVRYAQGTSTADRADVRDDAGTRAIEGLGMARAQLLKITDGDAVAATVRQLEAQPEVAYAEPNGIFYPAAVPPDDPEFGQQWGLFNFGQSVPPIGGAAGTVGADIDAVPAWNIETGDQNTVVAVMDTGADLQHPDLVNELWTNSDEIPANGLDDDGNGYIDDVNGYDFRSSDNNPTDLTGHGTHVSGIIAAQGDNNYGTTGVAYRAALMELRVCGTSYSPGCPVADEIAAMNYAGDNGAQVLNGSLQGGTFYQGMRDAASLHPDTLYVFAAGNGGSDEVGDNNDTSPVYPCAIDQPIDGVPAYSAGNVICVAATDQDDARAGFSNHGASSVDLGAPGVNILSSSSQKTLVSDDFEIDDFATEWQNSPGNSQDWERTNEAPLDSFGITDSQAADYGPNATSQATSVPVTLDPGYSSCEIDYDRAIDLASGDTFQLDVQLDTDNDGTPDVEVGRTFNQSNNSALLSRFFSLNSQFDQGGQLQVQLALTSNANSEGDGVHMDNIQLFCHGSPSDGGAELLDGTSMAAPMVSGAAALLFSDSPPLTAPSLVRAELLNSVDPVPELTGNTVSGGRLNVYRALVGDFNPASSGGGSGSVPSGNGVAGIPREPNTFFNRKPGRVVRTEKPRARVVFRFGSSEADSSFLCRLDSVEYSPCLKRFVRRLLPGRHVLKVKAVTSDGVEDPSAAVTRFRVKQIG